MNGEPNLGAWMVGSIALILFLAVAAFWIGPTYNVWAKEMDGRALLAEAEYSRQIAVVEAAAKKDAATSLAQAEVERAKGVAQANQIIAASITEPYLRYLWISELSTNGNNVIYVPTEAGLPILEAGKR